MPTLSIILGALGVVVVIVGLISLRGGRPPALSWGGIAIGVILLVAAGVTMAQGSAETTATESASAETTVSETPTAAAESAQESESQSTDSQESDVPVLAPTATPENLGDLQILYEDKEGYANFDGFRFVELTAYGPQDATPSLINTQQGDVRTKVGHATVKVGQEVYIEFKVQNLRKSSVRLHKGFVGAINPRGETVDIGAVHEGAEVERFQEFQVGVLVEFNEPGKWTVWPCYELIDEDDTLRNRCTDKWRYFEVTAEE